MNLTEFLIISLYFSILLLPIAGIAYGVFYINRRDKPESIEPPAV